MSAEDWQKVINDAKELLWESLDSRDDPDAIADDEGWIDEAEIWTSDERQQINRITGISSTS